MGVSRRRIGRGRVPAPARAVANEPAAACAPRRAERAGAGPPAELSDVHAAAHLPAGAAAGRDAGPPARVHVLCEGVQRAACD